MHQIKIKAKNGTTYIYEGETIWDKKAKKYRTPRTFIGTLNSREFVTRE